MNVKLLRSIHLYSGCFFAPLLIFFIVTGCLQTFHLHQSRKDGSYKAPAVLNSLSEVHKHQRWTSGKLWPASSNGFKLMVLLMSVGITSSILIGIVLAFKFSKAWVVWLCLISGSLIPCLFLWLKCIF